MPTFKHAPAASYRRTIEVSIPGDENKLVKQKIIMIFKRLPITELRTLLKKIKAAADRAEADAAASADDFDQVILLDNIVGWDNIPGEDDSPVLFSEDNMKELLDIACYRKAIMAAFLADIANPEAKNKGN